MNLYKHATNQAISLFGSRDIVDLKIQQSDWPRKFWPKFYKLDFSNVELMQEQNNTFNIDQIENYDQFLNKIKKPYFWPISPFLMHFFPKESSCDENFTGASNSITRFRKNYWSNTKKRTTLKDGKTNGRTERPYFIEAFWIQKTGTAPMKGVSNVIYFEFILCCQT